MQPGIQPSSVDCYLSSEAYYFYSKDITVLFRGIDDLNFSTQWSSYQRIYILLIHLLKELRAYNIKNFKVYSDNRIVEEVELNIEQLTQWGRGAFVYIEQNCLPYFVDFSFHKISTEELNSKIVEGERVLDAQRNESASIDYNDLSKRRLKRFKDEARNNKRRKGD